MAGEGSEAVADTGARRVVLKAWRRRVRQSIAQGEFLGAYDDAREGRRVHPDDLEIAYLGALALARSGATASAELEVDELLARRQGGSSPRLGEDIAALRARLAKDVALRTSGKARAGHAAVAATRYEEVFRQFGRPYSCINAATMWWLAGEQERAQGLARQALELCRRTRVRDAESRYWIRATEAEARLLLGDDRAAVDALDRARAAAPGMFGAWAATRRQLRLLSESGRGEPTLMARLPVPGVVHYCGHRFDAQGGLGEVVERQVEQPVRDALASINAGVGFGSLAFGADIVVAEVLLERGAELNVVLPFDVNDFLRLSVAPGGESWCRRFETCLASATSVVVATDGEHLGDDSLFGHGARVAMGLALVRARVLETQAVQLALWDGVPGTGVAGTGADVRAWRAGRRRTVVVSTGPRSPRSGLSPPPASERVRRGGRRTRAMLFGDIHGFGRLADSELRAFTKVVLGSLAQVLHRHQAPGWTLRTSGDGFFAVFPTPAAAARCAIDLQEKFATIDLARAGLPPWLGLRIGGHAGPVLRLYDPIRREYTTTACTSPGPPASSPERRSARSTLPRHSRRYWNCRGSRGWAASTSVTCPRPRITESCRCTSCDVDSDGARHGLADEPPAPLWDGRLSPNWWWPTCAFAPGQAGRRQDSGDSPSPGLPRSVGGEFSPPGASLGRQSPWDPWSQTTLPPAHPKPSAQRRAARGQVAAAQACA